MAPLLQQIQPVLAVPEVVAAVNFYLTLGFALVFQDQDVEPRYAVLMREGLELHLQWADAGQWVEGVDRPAYRFLVQDVEALFREFHGKGALNPRASYGPWAAPGNTPWGTREFHLVDPGKNCLQFYQPLAVELT